MIKGRFTQDVDILYASDAMAYSWLSMDILFLDFLWTKMALMIVIVRAEKIFMVV